MPALRTRKEGEALSPSEASSPASGVTPASKIKEVMFVHAVCGYKACRFWQDMREV